MSRFLSAVVLALSLLVFGHAEAETSSATPTSCLWYADHKALHQVATDTNAVTQSVALKDADVLAMNGSDCGVWVLLGKQLYKFDANAVQTRDIALDSLSKKLNNVSQLVVDAFDNSVWMADNKLLLHLDGSGQLLTSTTLPGDINTIAIALDQSLWALGKKALWHYSAQGELLSSQDLHELIDGNPKYFAPDDLGGVLWLAKDKQLTQLRLDQSNQPPLQISLPDDATGLTLDPRTGVLWVATKKTLLSYAADGTAGNTVDLNANDLKNVEKIAFDPVTQSLWVATEKSLARFSAQGVFVTSLPDKQGDGALAVPGFLMTPTLALVRPGGPLTNDLKRTP